MLAMRPAWLVLVAVAAFAQNPKTAKFPGSAASDKDMPPLVNRFTPTHLTADITATDTTIAMESTAGLITQALLTIGNEFMMICEVTDGTHVKIGLSSCANVDGRGLDGSGAAPHSNGALVNAYFTAGSINQALAEIKSVETYLLSSSARSIRILGYDLVGTGTAGVLQAADFTAAFAVSVNDGNAKTLTEASCISDTGSQTITVSVGGSTRFTMTCVVKASYSRATTDGSTGYIIAASMTNTAVVAGAVLDITGTANGSTKDCKVFAYATNN